MRRSGEPVEQPTEPGASRRISLARDIVNGAVRGDFAPELGLAGALTQAALGYVPLVGTAAALRDLAATWRRRRYLDATLNTLALVPVFGGVPKSVEAAHTALRVARALRGRQARRGSATR